MFQVVSVPEKLLMVAEDAIEYRVGMKVRLKGLTNNPELNGAKGVIMDTNVKPGAHAVSLQNGKVVSVLKHLLEPIEKKVNEMVSFKIGDFSVMERIFQNDNFFNLRTRRARKRKPLKNQKLVTPLRSILVRLLTWRKKFTLLPVLVITMKVNLSIFLCI